MMYSQLKKRHFEFCLSEKIGIFINVFFNFLAVATLAATQKNTLNEAVIRVPKTYANETDG